MRHDPLIGPRPLCDTMGDNFGRVSTHDGLCPVCDGLKTILRPQIALKVHPDLKGVQKLHGLPCPSCEPEDAELAVAQARQGQINKSLNRAKVPPKFQNVKFSDFKTGKDLINMGFNGDDAYERDKWKKRLYDYLSDLQVNVNVGVGLTLYGSVGTGKTLALSIVANALVRSGIDVVMLPENGIFSAVKSTFNEGSQLTEHDVIAQFRDVRVLMIDDFGVRAPSDWTMEIYHSIIDARWDKGLPTFISSNNDLNDLKEIYPRQMDRLSSNLEIKMFGRSMRG